MNGAEVRVRRLQSVQTQNLFDLTIAGNTVGVGALVSSGTLTLAGGNNITLSQAGGNAITISGPNVHNVTLAGNSTSAGAGFVQISTGTMTIAGGNNITLSQVGNAITVSAFNQTDPTLSIWNNMFATGTDSVFTPKDTFALVNLNPAENVFPGNMTVSTAYLDLIWAYAIAGTSTVLFTIKLGIYTRTGKTLSLLNSISASFSQGVATVTDQTNFRYLGAYWLTIHSSAWSIPPVFSRGGEYYLAYAMHTSGNSQSLSIIGNRYLYTSGTVHSDFQYFTHGGAVPFVGISSSFANTQAFPVSIGTPTLNKTDGNYAICPHLIFDAVLGNF